jgi:hypothetical protein
MHSLDPQQQAMMIAMEMERHRLLLSHNSLLMHQIQGSPIPNIPNPAALTNNQRAAPETGFVVAEEPAPKRCRVFGTNNLSARKQLTAKTKWMRHYLLS